MKLMEKIRIKWMKLRLQPIRVFCLHHVCERFDAEWINECDWMPIDEFMRKVLALQQSGVEFISLTDAYNKLAHSLSPIALRLKRYAVITFDDGYASLKEIVPWLNEQNIPVTLFVNPDYAAGKAYRKIPKEQYLSLEELNQLAGCPLTGKPMEGAIEIGMHGAQHQDVSKMSLVEFRAFAEESIAKTQFIASRLSPIAYIPFWAYTWGRHNSMTDEVLKRYGIIPVLVDGMKNYNDATCIHRELL